MHITVRCHEEAALVTVGCLYFGHSGDEILHSGSFPEVLCEWLASWNRWNYCPILLHIVESIY